MRTTITALMLTILLIGCSEDEVDFNENLTDGFCIVSNNKVILSHNDFDYYDYSTHLIYLKDQISFDEDIESIGAFQVFAGKEEIYSGQTLPGYSSFLPSIPVIPTQPSFYSNNIIPIEFTMVFDSLGKFLPDPRKDERIVKALKKHNQYHAGLSCEIKSVEFTSTTNVKVELLLKNNDSFNYYFIDPEKTGIGLFHYFSNGLLITDFENHKTYTHKIDVISVKSWNTWKKEWLSIINANESKVITIIYNNFDAVPKGQYKANLVFPGLTHQVDKKDINQENGKVWLGKLNARKEITIE